jgi:hypothetical protein
MPMLVLATTEAPGQTSRGHGKTRLSREAFLEDLEFLLDNGVSEDDITRRLNYSTREHLRTRLYRMKRQDLLDRLTRARSGDAELRRTA